MMTSEIKIEKNKHPSNYCISKENNKDNENIHDSENTFM